MQRRIAQTFSFFLVWLSNRQSHTFAFARQHRSFSATTTTTATATRWMSPAQQGQGLRLALQARGGAAATADGSAKLKQDDSSSSTKGFILGPLLSLGKQYSAALDRAPILTKSITAGCIFALSDYLAQRLENKQGKNKFDWPRTFTSAAVGLFCFGPAAHAWYQMIFRVFPGTGLLSTLQKASMGQLFFGPSFTCIFFAASLLQTGQFSLGSWFRKIRSDLPGTWVSGLCFWPLVDLVSYSLIPVQFIPLFVNICSLLWTIYLSSVANRAARTD